MSNTFPLPFALTAYGLPHVMGYLATQDGTPHPSPLGVFGLMDAAAEMSLAAVEIPLTRPGTPSVPELADAMQERGLRLVPDWLTITGGTTAEFTSFLEASQALGANVVRATLSHILCGDRRPMAGGWPAYLETVADRLRELLPIAEHHGMAIALENHQDATSDDLLRLYEATGKSAAFGICLDAGNPLAVGEGCVEFARRVAPLIRHIHLKDYTMHFAPNGYRLVRCAAGAGVVDFPAILEIVRNNGHDVLPGIEIAAQPTRTIPLLEDGWWACHTPEQSRHLPEALRTLWAQGCAQTEPYGSAWELGGDTEAVSAEEWAVVRQSAAYFRSLGAG